MTERPINLSAWEVPAILAGRKTQLRRIVKRHDGERPLDYGSGVVGDDFDPMFWWADGDANTSACPLGAPGDRLWVREAWTSGYQDGGWGTIFRADSTYVQGKRSHPQGPHFHAKEIGPHIRWRSSTHMPRWASRITLEVLDVRVQRVQEISEEDAKAEGVAPNEWANLRPDGELSDRPFGAFRAGFAELWGHIHGPAAWERNDWIWAVTFRRLEAA